MDGEKAGMLLLAETQQRRAQERAAGEVERLYNLFGDPPGGFSSTRLRRQSREIDDRADERHSGRDHLDRLGADQAERGPQRLVPAHDLGEGAVEQRAPQTPGEL